MRNTRTNRFRGKDDAWDSDYQSARRNLNSDYYYDPRRCAAIDAVHAVASDRHSIEMVADNIMRAAKQIRNAHTDSEISLETAIQIATEAYKINVNMWCWNLRKTED